MLMTLKKNSLQSTSEPSEVKMIKPKHEASECRIYILYYKKSDRIRVADLRPEVSSLFNLRVRFECYSPRKNGPTQCSRCQDYNHGAESCFRAHRCIRCGDNHESKQYPHLSKIVPKIGEKPQIPQDCVKCVNCGGNHTANQSKCSYRATVAQKQQYFRSIYKEKQQVAPPEFDEFPELPQQTKAHELDRTFNWSRNTIPPQQDSTMQALQRFLDPQNNMASNKHNA